MTTHHRIPTTIAVILALAAASAPAATARPAEDPATPINQPATAAYSRPDKSLIPVSQPSGHSTSTQATAPQAVVRITTPASGFDWGDAGIGAAGGIGIALLAAGSGLLVVRTRRDHLDLAKS